LQTSSGLRGPFASYCESLTIIVEAAAGIAGGDLQLFVFSVEIYSKQEQLKRTVASVSRDVFLLEIRCSFGAHRPTCEMIIMLSMLSWLQAGMYTIIHRPLTPHIESYYTHKMATVL